MKPGIAGYIVRATNGVGTVEQESVWLHWRNSESVVVRRLNGDVYELEEGELFVPETDEFTGAKIFVR